MKKIILLIIISSFAFATDSTRTSIFKLPQWSAGSKLLAGTKSDSSQSNFGLNNGFYRLETMLSQILNGNGLVKQIYGDSANPQGNLYINASYYSGDAKRVVIADSLFVSYNIMGMGDLLIRNNVHVGGYVSVDSIKTSSDFWIGNALNVGGEIKTYGSLQSLGGGLALGTAGDNNGTIVLTNDQNAFTTSLSAPDLLAGHISITLPNRSGKIALQTANDSIQAPTVHAVLFNSPMVSGVSLNDSAGNIQEWSTNATAGRTIVRLKYVHKAGIKNVVLRGQFKTSPNDWAMTVYVGSISNGETGSSGTYESGIVTLDVSGLTPNTAYDLTAKLACVISGTAYAKELVITAESN